MTSAIWRFFPELHNPLSLKLADKHALSKMNIDGGKHVELVFKVGIIDFGFRPCVILRIMEISEGVIRLSR